MSDVQAEIALQELKLPKTGYTVVLAPYLTTGQSRELQRVILEGGNFDPDTGKIGKMSVDSFLKMQDKAAQFLIKEVKNKEGISQPFDFDWLSNLPIDDGNLVYEKINKLTQQSTLAQEAKKK